MSTNLNYKQVTNVSRRTWDVEAYEKKAKARQQETADATAEQPPVEAKQDEKEEFVSAESGAAGPEGSKRAFLKARRSKVDIDSKVGTSEMVSVEAAARTSAKKDDDVHSIKDDVVVKTGVGWHCKICDCFLKDSHTYLDHINGRKHQRKLGYSMRVERSTKDQLLSRLSRLSEEKNAQEKDSLIDDTAQTNYDDIVKAKDEALQLQKEERKRKRKERKQRLAQTEQAEEEPVEEEEDAEEVEEEGIDPAMAAMMGFSGFGGSNKHG